MKVCVWITASLLVAASMGVLSVRSFGADGRSEKVDIFRMSDNGEIRNQQFKTLEDEHNQLLWNCLNAIRLCKDNPREKVAQSNLWYAVRACALQRDPRAVDALLDLIDLRFDEFVTLRLPTDATMITLLSQIGKPASNGALQRLSSDKSSVRAPMYLRVLFLVEGPEVGKFMLQNAIVKEQDLDKKARLQKALDLFGNADKVVP
jgi:hypothetical protein